MNQGTSGSGARRWLTLGALTALLLALLAGAAFGVTGSGGVGKTQPKLLPGTQYPAIDEESEEELFAQDRAFVAGRTAGDNPLDIAKAGQLRAKAAHDAKSVGKTAPPSGPASFSGAWSQTGPQPTLQIQRSDLALSPVSGRIGALAVRPSTGQLILGAAQGGIWRYDNGAWTPRTNDQETQAVGALAVAPSDDKVIYAGTGEGSLSGDSYFGNGILRSNDGGGTWSKVSGDYFQGVSVSRLVVDPRNSAHVYAAVLRGRGGSRRVTVQPHSRYGIWESTDGGATWTLRREVTEAHGATDIEMDPQNPDVLYASFWSDGIYKSTNGGATWTSLMGNFGLTSPDFSADDVRFGLSISHPHPGGTGVLYAGFPWKDASGEHESKVWRSTTAARRGPSCRAATTARTARTTRSRTTATSSARTTTSSRPTRTTRTSSSRPVSTATTSARRAAACSAPTTAGRRGRTWAGTSTRTSTRSRSTPRGPAMWSSAPTAACGRAATSADGPTGRIRSTRTRGRSSTAPGWRSRSSAASPPTRRSRAGCGAARRTTAPSSSSTRPTRPGST